MDFREGFGDVGALTILILFHGEGDWGEEMTVYHLFDKQHRGDWITLPHTAPQSDLEMDERRPQSPRNYKDPRGKRRGALGLALPGTAWIGQRRQRPQKQQ